MFDSVFRLFGALAMLVGTLLAGLGVRAFARARMAARTWAPAWGIVTDDGEHMSKTPDEGYSRVYQPTVKFKTAAGEEIEWTQSYRSGLSKRTVGSRVAMLYDPDEPGSARIAQGGPDRVGCGLFGTGAVFLLVGLLFWWVGSFSIGRH